MPVFEYKGKTVTGSPVEGELKAKDRAELERILRRNKVLVDKISRKPSQINIRFGSGIKKVHISRFTRQFATMIGAGLPMVQCLDILSKQMDSQEFCRIITEIKDAVSSGSTLSEAMKKHKKAFDDLYVNMVEAGEMGGALDTILVRLAGYREKADCPGAQDQRRDGLSGRRLGGGDRCHRCHADFHRADFCQDVRRPRRRTPRPDAVRAENFARPPELLSGHSRCCRRWSSSAFE